VNWQFLNTVEAYNRLEIEQKDHRIVKQKLHFPRPVSPQPRPGRALERVKRMNPNHKSAVAPPFSPDTVTASLRQGEARDLWQTMAELMAERQPEKGAA
jgi:asparagine synthetase B (glutamine-hydrolysing)